MTAPGVIIEGASLFLEFLTFAIPKVRGLAAVAFEFSELKGIPIPNLEAWAAEDARVDAALRAPVPTEPELPPLRSGDPDK